MCCQKIRNVQKGEKVKKKRRKEYENEANQGYREETDYVQAEKKGRKAHTKNNREECAVRK